jgi:hypothetical protein
LTLCQRKKYAANIYSDDDSIPVKTKIKIEPKPVTSTTVIEVPLKHPAYWLPGLCLLNIKQLN